MRPVEGPTEAAATEIEIPAVEDELQARRQQRVLGGRWIVERLETTDRTAVEATETPAAPDGGQEPLPELRRAEEQLAAAEAAHWQSEFDLADAEAAVEAADDAVSSLDTKRIEARRDRVTAQRHLAEAQSRQRNAVNLLAEARRRLDAAKRMSDRDE
jgi:chromosome segregation ATPase